jgi:hypothetical protein
MNNINKPKRPLTRIITEGTSGTCSICKSTEIKRFIFFGRSIGCIQPECENYYKRCKKIFPDEFDKEWKDWKYDMVGFLLAGFILGVCFGLLI